MTDRPLSVGDGMLGCMATCTVCDLEMITAASCTADVLHLRGKPLPVIPFGRDEPWRQGERRCGDCGVSPGGYHHLGCDAAWCPSCRRQLFSCGCPFDEFGAEQYDEEAEDAYVWDAYSMLTSCHGEPAGEEPSQRPAFGPAGESRT